MDFEQAFALVVGIEGRYVNNPLDRGGETMFGITVAEARRNGYAGPMSALPLDKAKEIYLADYWKACGADQYAAAIGFEVFDAAVNHGVTRAVQFLQLAAAVPVDGVAGAQTVGAVRSQPAARIEMLFLAARLRFFARSPKDQWGEFGEGWINRCAKNLEVAAADMGSSQ